MDKGSSKTAVEQVLFAGDAWFDPIEAGIRDRTRGLIEELVEQEHEAALGRGRYERAGTPAGHRNGHRTRHLTGSFGTVEFAVRRARLLTEDGGSEEWRSAELLRHARRTRQLEALIAGAYLAGTNTRRVQRALAALFLRALGKDVVSHAWRKVK
ncbi:transposase, partial [Paracraurococcus lichenis]|uniref:transposase n=1 Tax=Paracraurococcus lichenis TaxID=3064888 RepID=UPI00351CE264